MRCCGVCQRGQHLGDFDRMLLAQAQAEGLTLVSAVRHSGV
ncbi:TPA: hypothetical protein ACGQSM_003555 [Serratia liquefaciens]